MINIALNTSEKQPNVLLTQFPKNPEIMWRKALRAIIIVSYTMGRLHSYAKVYVGVEFEIRLFSSNVKLGRNLNGIVNESFSWEWKWKGYQISQYRIEWIQNGFAWSQVFHFELSDRKRVMKVGRVTHMENSNYRVFCHLTSRWSNYSSYGC